MRTLEERIMADARSGHPCIKCGHEGGVYGRHYNGIMQHKYGKGRGIKCHPFLVADFCKTCEKDYQEGKVPKSDWNERLIYSEDFQHWILMTLIRRANNGVIQ